MTDPFRAARDAVIAKFQAHAAALFAADDTRRSALLAVAQYWNDSANDEVHAHVVVSARETPVWPHECAHDDGDETTDWEPRGVQPLLVGEGCWWCAGEAVDMRFYGGYGDATVGAIETFCAEGAHQSMEIAQAYAPFAIARRAGAGVAIELVGRALRPPATTIGSARAATAWPDARARALFEEVCRHAADDAPRAVLSDYLLEHHPGDPRGEAIALALARELDADARARRDALFAEHGEGWLFPLGDVLAPAGAHFERGFLARADVYAASAADRDRVLDAPAWGTVHTITFAPQSLDVIAPTMHGLRSVGPLRDTGAGFLARAARPWAIEHLVLEDGDHRPLLDARTLPRLAHLELAAQFRDRLDDFRRAPWWPQLARLAIADAEGADLDASGFAGWRALRDRLGVRELAIITPGWQLGLRADDVVTVRAGTWAGEASLARLGTLAQALPATAALALVSTRHRAFAEPDVTWLRATTGRDIVLDRGHAP